jgi:hypothetical protein
MQYSLFFFYFYGRIQWPTSTYSNLVDDLRNVSIEDTTAATPIEPCSAEGNCIFTKFMEHQFCHCDINLLSLTEVYPLVYLIQ